ncbi:MAG TPA: YjgN family protein [Xanthomonadaceae bacterium]|nr:YjgN family protein [Xanthomonadaceae bacterium]
MEAFLLEASDSLPTEVAPTRANEHRFRFSGTTEEYFRIWIVNVALSILSLGVYSAWATVRTRRWFYAHTWVGDAPFDYRARPLPILIGRGIAFVLLVTYFLSEYFLADWSLLVLLGIFCLVPALVVRGLRFRARYSVWRGVSFQFLGAYRDAYLRYLLAYLLLLPTLGLMMPMIKAWQKEYLVRHHRFGGWWFKCEPLGSGFFGIYAVGIGLGIVLFVAFIMAMMAVSMAIYAGGEESEGARTIALPLLALLFYVGLLLIGVFISTRVTNTVYNNTELGPFTFRSSLRARRMAYLYVTNTLAMVASFGLAIPWAKVRLARYRAECLTLLGPADFDRFLSQHADDELATGAELADAFGVDIAL